VTVSVVSVVTADPPVGAPARQHVEDEEFVRARHFEEDAPSPNAKPLQATHTMSSLDVVVTTVRWRREAVDGGTDPRRIVRR
jgi:hypothetical protein